MRSPKYRAPGSDHWTEISWDDALDKLARKLKSTRDANWVATEKDGEQGATRRTLALAVLRGALLDLLATGDEQRVTVAVRYQLALLRRRGPRGHA